MSEAEKLKSAEYRQQRKKLIFIQVIAIIVLAVLSLGSLGIYYAMNKAYYINYNEKGGVDYKVYLKPNDYFDSEYLDDGLSYVASLIDHVQADFDYSMQTEAGNVRYDYSYKIDNVLRILNKSDNKVLFEKVYPVKALQTFTHSTSNVLNISESFSIDYVNYNNLANAFVTTYKLSDVTCTLSSRMSIAVVSDGELFENNHNKNYVLSLNLPLSVTTVDVKMTSSIPASQTKILAVDRFENKDVFKTLATIFVTATIVLGVALLLFIYLTRNKDINYIIKVKRLLNSYRSYIQQITVPIDKEGKQVLTVSSFQELLEIRDTIQKPDLMYENDDKTLTEFLIPTETAIIYAYEIKVDDYDEIYSTNEESTMELAFTSQVTETESQDSIEEEQLENRLKDLKDVDYSFDARLCLAEPETKTYYQKLWQFITSFDVKVTKSWKHVRIYKGRQNLGYMLFRGKKLSVALALDVDKYKDTKYRFTDMTNYKKFEDTKLLMKLTSDRKFKHVLELLQALFDDNNVKKVSDGEFIKKPINKSKKRLIGEGLIKIN